MLTSMTRAGALMLFAAAVVAAVVIPFTWQTNVGRLVAWLIVGAGVVAMVIAVAPDVPGLRSVLIDERNRYSLPALITLGWFVTIVSAYLACAEWNTALWVPDPHKPVPLWIS